MDTFIMQKCEIVRTSSHTPVMRRSVAFLAAGQAIGLAAVFLLISWFLPAVAHEADRDQLPDFVSSVNALNTAWVLIAAFLLFGMQVGFFTMEAGFARDCESVNMLINGIAHTCICGVLFWAIGFAFMLEHGHGVIGSDGFFLHGHGDICLATGVPALAFLVFQFAFADTASRRGPAVHRGREAP